MLTGMSDARRESALLPGLGHNAHVEDPRAVAALLPPLLAAPVR
jgi:hypothetical protein